MSYNYHVSSEPLLASELSKKQKENTIWKFTGNNMLKAVIDHSLKQLRVLGPVCRPSVQFIVLEMAAAVLQTNAPPSRPSVELE